MTDSKEKMERLYSEYYPKIKGYILKKTGSFSDTEDIASDVMVKVFKNIGKFDESKSSISTWIYNITKNTVIDFFRTSHKDKLTYDDEIANTLTSSEDVCDDDLENLASALEKLDERERKIIILYYYNAYSLKEIAIMNNMSYSNIKIIHKKALKELKLYME